jgi:hypothetical protein
MTTIQDSLYNWLTIKVVRDARPTDVAATQTEEMFRDLLKQEHGISEIHIDQNEDFYFVTYVKDEQKGQFRFPRELIHVMLNQINESPDRFKIYPEYKEE